MCSGWALSKEAIFSIINFNQYENKLSIVIDNRHKMGSENLAFDNKFIAKKSLKLHLNLSWFKLYTISPKKRQFILADT